MDMLTLRCEDALARAQQAIDQQAPVTAACDEIGRLADLVKMEAAFGSNKTAAALLFVKLGTAKASLRRLWAHPTDEELVKQIALLEAALVPVDAYLNGAGRWPECRSEAMESDGRVLRAALRYRKRQANERVHSLQAI